MSWHEDLTTSSSEKTPETTIALVSGAWRISSFDRKQARSLLFSGQARKPDQSEGRGTFLSLMVLLICFTPFVLSLRVSFLMEYLLYLSKTMSILLKDSPSFTTDKTIYQQIAQKFKYWKAFQVQWHVLGRQWLSTKSIQLGHGMCISHLVWEYLWEEICYHSLEYRSD